MLWPGRLARDQSSHSLTTRVEHEVGRPRARQLACTDERCTNLETGGQWLTAGRAGEAGAFSSCRRARIRVASTSTKSSSALMFVSSSLTAAATGCEDRMHKLDSQCLPLLVPKDRAGARRHSVRNGMAHHRPVDPRRDQPPLPPAAESTRAHREKALPMWRPRWPGRLWTPMDCCRPPPTACPLLGRQRPRLTRASLPSALILCPETRQTLLSLPVNRRWSTASLASKSVSASSLPFSQLVQRFLRDSRETKLALLAARPVSPCTCQTLIHKRAQISPQDKEPTVGFFPPSEAA